MAASSNRKLVMRYDPSEIDENGNHDGRLMVCTRSMTMIHVQSGMNLPCILTLQAIFTLGTGMLWLLRTAMPDTCV